MTIHVSIGEAKTRLSELVAAAARGEDVVVSEAGRPKARLVAVATEQDSDETLEQRRQKRLSALGMWKDMLEGVDTTVPPSMTDEEVEERWRRKFGPAA